MYLSRSYLWLHKHQINEQNHEIMLHVFVRETLASRALSQSHVSTSSSDTARLDGCIRTSCLVARCVTGVIVTVKCTTLQVQGWDCFRGGFRAWRFVTTAVEDVIKLRDGITAFNTNGHASAEMFTSLMSNRCCEIDCL